MATLDSDELGGDPLAGQCPRCGQRPRWESVADAEGERWLSVCRCGRLQAFLPEQPSLEPNDPLTVFLQGVGRAVRPATPAWIRLFLQSLGEPFHTAWHYRPGLCPACVNGVCFFFHACPRPYWLAGCSLCLA